MNLQRFFRRHNVQQGDVRRPSKTRNMRGSFNAVYSLIGMFVGSGRYADIQMLGRLAAVSVSKSAGNRGKTTNT